MPIAEKNRAREHLEIKGDGDNFLFYFILETTTLD